MGQDQNRSPSTGSFGSAASLVLELRSLYQLQCLRCELFRVAAVAPWHLLVNTQRPQLPSPCSPRRRVGRPHSAPSWSGASLVTCEGHILPGHGPAPHTYAVCTCVVWNSQVLPGSNKGSCRSFLLPTDPQLAQLPGSICITPSPACFSCWFRHGRSTEPL